MSFNYWADAYLANGLENRYGVFEVSNMEYRDNKLNVRVVPDAIDGRLATSFTEGTFVGCSLHQTSNQEIGLGHRIKQRTRRRSKTPFFTGNRSVAVYRSR